MGHDEQAKSEPEPIPAEKEVDGPLDLGREPVMKGDLASTARWLDGRRAQAQDDVIRRAERHSGALRVTNDHLVLIRTDIAGLRGELSKGFDTTQRNLASVHHEMRKRRGRIRWLLAALLGFVLGLAVPLHGVLNWMQGVSGGW